MPKNSEICQPGDFVSLPGHDGYISSNTAQISGNGRQGCPWRIQAEPGQWINITLITFNHPDDLTEDSNYG